MQVLASGQVAYAAAGGWARLPAGPYATDGLAGDADPPVPADANSLFDLASLTKVVATLPLVLLLHQRGRLEHRRSGWPAGCPARRRPK